jgi:hypothetical protein
MVALKKQPGFIAVVGDHGDISVINVFTMHLHSQQMYEF